MSAKVRLASPPGSDPVWVADDLSGTITSVDPDTLEVGTPIEVSGHIDDVEAGAGAVWTLDTDAGVVSSDQPRHRFSRSPSASRRPADGDPGLGIGFPLGGEQRRSHAYRRSTRSPGT